MNNKGFIIVGLAIAIIILLSIPFIPSILIRVHTADLIYEKIEEIPQKEVALILGAAAYGNRLSDILRDRVDVGIELYEADKIQKIIMSGAPNEAEAMQLYAIEAGVPKKIIIQDDKGLNTLSSIKNTSINYKDVIIVTQKYHLPRALFMARYFDINAIGLMADKREYAKIFDFKKREILATAKAVVELFLLQK